MSDDAMRRLITTLREELEALHYWQCVTRIPADVREGMQISADKIERVLDECGGGSMVEKWKEERA